MPRQATAEGLALEQGVAAPAELVASNLEGGDRALWAPLVVAAVLQRSRRHPLEVPRSA